MSRWPTLNKGGLLLVMTGPSGVGKSTLVGRVQEKIPEVRFSVSCTTRPPRVGEVDGEDYFFSTPEQFAERLRRGDFLEHATVHGNSYGTLRDHVMDEVGRGGVVLLDIDVQGAEQVRNSGTPASYLFILPPSFEVLETRLRGRATDSEEVIARRLGVARSEIAEADRFDYRIINDDIDRAAGEFVGLVESLRAELP